MTLTGIEQHYLTALRHGRLATVAPDGTPQNRPVGFHDNAELGTIPHTRDVTTPDHHAAGASR
jgi:pyridoxamine 5'-phosphate oxidase family protein